MRHAIAAVVLGLAVTSGVAQANEPANQVRLAMTTLPGISNYAPVARALPQNAPIAQRTLTKVSEQLDRQLEQRLADKLAAQAQ